MKKRASGILCHITSIPSPHGIGDLGPSSYSFADFLVETKQTYWQVLPLHPTAASTSFSPYNILSAFAGNPTLVSLDLLVRDGLLDADDCKFPVPGVPTSIEYPAATECKNAVLRKAFQRFREEVTIPFS